MTKNSQKTIESLGKSQKFKKSQQISTDSPVDTSEKVYLLLNLPVISQQLILSSFDLDLNRYWLTVDSSMPILWSNTNDTFKITLVKAIVVISTISNSGKKTQIAFVYRSIVRRTKILFWKQFLLSKQKKADQIDQD